MLEAAGVASSPATGLIVGVLLAMFGGLIGAAGWLTGGYRKSVAEARNQDIATLDHRVTTLMAENAELRAKVAAQEQAIKVLLDKAQGTEQLAKLTDLVVAQHQMVVAMLERIRKT